MEFEYRYTDKCIFKGSCPRQDRIGCDINCPIQPEFYYLLHSSNIPNQYKKLVILYPSDVDMKTFNVLADIKNDVENFVKDGRFLYLWGNAAGNGKSTFACKIMKAYLASICIGNGFKDRAWFEYIPSFLLLAKEFDSEERKLHIEALTKRDLVVLDDIGAVHNTQYDITVLSDIINTRYSNGLATIVTSNISPTNMGKALSRLTDRLCSDIVLEMKGGGRRKSVSTYKRLGDDE